MPMATLADTEKITKELSAYPYMRVCSKIPQAYYINGIMSPGPVAQLMAAKDLQTYMDIYGVRHFGDVISLHNPSEGLLLDVFRKLVLQKYGEKFSHQARAQYIENLNLLSFGLSNTLSDDDSYQALNAIAALSADIFNKKDAAAYSTLNKASNEIMVYSSYGLKQVIVAHSEGNMFAQAIYARSQEPTPPYMTDYHVRSHFQVVNIATPAAKPDTGKYVTSSKDIIINYLARALSGTLGFLSPAAANYDSGISTYFYDKFGHGFQEVYLNLQLGLQQIVMKLIRDATNDAESRGYSYDKNAFHIKINGSGSITITAPDGKQTAVRTEINNQNGNDFSLSCDQMQPGIYHINATVTPYFESYYKAYFSVKTGPYFWDNNYSNLLSYNDGKGSTTQPKTYGPWDLVVEKDELADGYKILMKGEEKNFLLN